jgi:Fur family ferric uptake transcriptional regulator
MKQIHLKEKEQFKKLFKQEYIDSFEDRFAILEVFLQTEKHVTVDELVRLLEQNGHRLDPQFVRETLKLMCRFGFAHKSRFDNGQARYEHRHLGQHHDHMICTRCRQIIEFEEDQLEKLQIQIAASRPTRKIANPDSRLPRIPHAPASHGNLWHMFGLSKRSHPVDAVDHG